MRKIYLVLLLIFIGIGTNAQTTWVQKLSYNIVQGGYGDTLTGVRQIETGADGSQYLLAHISNRNLQYIYKFLPGNRYPEWNVWCGVNGSNGTNWTEGFKTTSDSGMILCFNATDASGPIKSNVMKYSKSGNLEWSKPFECDTSNEVAYDVIEKSQGIYYVLINDSMYTLNSYGDIIDSTAAISGNRFSLFLNGDFLIYSNNNLISRVDSLGNTLWNHPCEGDFDYDSTSVFIGHLSSHVTKVNALTGTQDWNINLGYSPISAIEKTGDGGCMISIGEEPEIPINWGVGTPMPGQLIRLDSIGDTVWTRTYPLPHFGLSTINIIPGGNIMTGGCYMSGVGGSIAGEHSAFYCMMNSDASYPLQQTSQVYVSDANNDLFSNYVDDILQTMLAFGSSGIRRDSSLDGFGPDSAFGCMRPDIAIDWQTSSASGINHKHSDFDGNGIVDLNDILAFENCPWALGDSVHFNQKHAFQTNAQFHLIPKNDTILPGEDAWFYMVMGSDTNPVDSIYGFAISLFIEHYSNPADSIEFYNTGLGIDGIDLLAHHRFTYVNYPNYEYRLNTFMCRTDFQNAINVFDTVALVRFRGPFYSTIVTPTIADFKAIWWDGMEIPFSLFAGSVFVDSSFVAISDRELNKLKIYPNPADEYLTISCNDLSQKNIVLMSAHGQKIKQILSAEKNIRISMNNFRNGFYTGSIITDKGVQNFSFVVQH